MTTSSLIPRTCTEIATDDSAPVSNVGSQPLSAFRDVLAYVLLGEPGSGKTTEYEQECRALGKRAELISARRFAKADTAAHPEWRDKVLFIDGLDETRASVRRNTTALDEIQSRLDALGRPSFRISCRAADWLGPVDRGPLTDVAPDYRVTTLNLDPLDRTAVHEHLKSELDVEDPTAFIHAIVSSGVDFMLNNPLLLKLLIASVSGSDFDASPSSRREVFERSCRTLATEHNQLHPRSTQTFSPERVLAAASRLCAIQLLANKEGYALGSAHADAGFIPVAEASSDVNEMPALREAISTNLFRAAAEQHIVPVHRQVAEYLGASYLVGLVDGGTVSAGRVCAALLSPVDSRVVTDLRGLAAWLGTLSAPARSLLIAADPVGMALYGDISEWPVADRRKLLDRLVAQARPEDLWGYMWFDTTEHRYRHATGGSFRSLCKPDMADTLGEYLDIAKSGTTPSHILELLLQALSEAEDGWLDQLSGLAPRISQLALDVRTQPDVRLAALLAFARIERSESEIATTLGDALDAFRKGRLADPDDRIGGPLLRLLYPEVIAPSRIWVYASLLHRGSVGSESWRFWRHTLCDETPADDMADLLDEFADDTERLWPIMASAFAEKLPWTLLARATQEVGHKTEPARLYRWIAAVAVTYARRTTSTDEHAGLLKWLAGNQAISRELLSIWIARSIEVDAGLDERYFLRGLLLADYPPDFISWCISAARERQRAEPEVARAFVREAYYALPKMREQFATSMDDLRSEIGSDNFLTEALDSLTSRSSTSAEINRADEGWRRKLADTEAKLERERKERRRDWSSHLRDHIHELRTNSFSAPKLHTLASAYFGLLMEVNDDVPPVDRIADFIGDDPEILGAVLDALRNAPTRADVPSVERTAELTAEAKHDWLAYPVLAGLAIRQAEGSLDPSWLSASQRRQAIAIAATALLNPDQQPSWAVDWLHEDPTLVLDVLHRCAVAEIRKGETHLSMLNWLLEVDGLDDELRDFRLGLLRSMSVRMPHVQLQLFDYVVGLVLKHPDSGPLLKLSARKLASTSMTDAQRVRWMTLDGIMNGGEALRLLDDFIGSNAKRARQLAEFFPRGFAHAAEFVNRLLGDQPCAALRTLVDIIGRNFPPRELKSGEAVWVGPAEEMSDLVNRWINDLGGQPTEEAGAALDALISDERLSAWHSRLEVTRDRQQRLHSDTAYAPMEVAGVIALLRNGPPNNVADLRVLLCDHLRDLNTHISGDNSDLWRQFWADDQETQPKKPKHEDSCRDALMAMLRIRLPEGVDAQPEGQYAADRRADIRVGFKDFNIPIEIKKNTHRDLWTAIDDQLIANYTTDPATGGYGIYVVLWFGSGIPGYPRHPTDGYKPTTPDELERRLNESLSHEQRRKISVVVLDVTKP